MRTLPAAQTPDEGRVRRRQRRRRPDVRRRGARARARTSRACRSSAGPGKLLDELLGEVGLERGDVFITNVISCRPPGNRDPLPEEIEACKPYLYQQIELIEPKVICTLGNFATKLLTGDPTGHHQGPRAAPGARARRARPCSCLPALPPGRGAAQHRRRQEQLREDFARLPAAARRASAGAEGRWRRWRPAPSRRAAADGPVRLTLESSTAAGDRGRGRRAGRPAAARRRGAGQRRAGQRQDDLRARRLPRARRRRRR